MSSSRKEWRVVSDQSLQNSHDEDLESSKLGQLDERTIYEVQQGRQQLDIEFGSVTGEDGADNEILQQRLHNVTRQREELQDIEVDIKAQVVARSQIMEMRRTYSKQIKGHTSAIVQLQEQLRESEQTIRELERKVEEKERDLHDNQLANEAIWAKEDLLREQSNELAAFRREMDKSQAERAQHINQIHELQEHIKEKERQLIELQEQNRIAQDTTLFKDEQLREAQSWISRVQEMDALQSNTSHSLQTELRERTEQYNHLWIGCQRQFAEMERFHLHTVQQLQLQLAEARGGVYTDKPTVVQTDLKDGSHSGKKERDSTDDTSSNRTFGSLPNGNLCVPVQSDPVHGFQITPMSTLEKSGYIPSGHIAPLYSYVMHQQGVSTSVPSDVSECRPNQVQAIPGVIPSLPHWQNPQHIVNVSQIPSRNQVSQEEQGSLQSDPRHEIDVANGHSLHTSYTDVQEVSKDFSLKLNDALRLNIRHNIITGEMTSDQELAKKSDSQDHTGGQEEKNDEELSLLDERTLLACIGRTIPPSSKIRISSTLPNRLGRMLAPLKWLDYKRKYGRLEEFVASHPELFVIEEDFIQLREGAQEIIAATAAVAKVAAAAASLPPSSSSLPSVAVTPMAQSHRPKNHVRNGSNPAVIVLEGSKAEARRIVAVGSPRG